MSNCWVEKMGVLGNKARFYLDPVVKKKVEELISNIPIFKKMKMKDLFLLGLAIGVKKDMMMEKEKRGEQIADVTVFTDEEQWLIASVAVWKTGNVNILIQPEKMLEIAEKYANAGILELYDMYFKNPDTFVEELDLKIKESWKDGGK